MESSESDIGFDWGKFGLVLFIVLLVVGVFIFIFSKPSGESSEDQANANSEDNELVIGVNETNEIGGVDEMNDDNTKTNQNDVAKDVTELVIEDIKVGDGDEAVAGKSVTVHYTGTLTDGTKFDSSKDHGQPFTFELGAGQVIKGWDQGVAGMKVEGIRKLTIPADLAYGERGSPPEIGPGATLVFEIELLGVE